METTTTPAAPAPVRERKKDTGPRLTALELARTPRSARWLGRGMILTFFVLPAVVFALPWQQSFHAAGRVIAFDPSERMQNVEAPVDGRIHQWYVMEGDEVKAGQKLVSIRDPDPDLPRHLNEQRLAVTARATAARDRMASFDIQIASLKASRDDALKAVVRRKEMGKERVRAADEALRAAKARVSLETINLGMENDLRKDGLTSRLNLEAAKARQQQADAERNRAMNTLNAAKEEVEAIEADKGTIKNNADAAIASASASRQSAEAELASATRDLHELEIRIARQDSQEVTSPCDGVVYRILANAQRGGALVKYGDRLASITPTIGDSRGRVVELFLAGNDAPQLMELMARRSRDEPVRVRVHFEGYPAIQFVGWPSVAVGTFGGTVKLLDQHDDGKGRFRVLVEPDPDAEKEWPSASALRQGTRAQGWLLLDRVPLWYEVWRRFNGFPPVSVEKDDGEMKSKPGKVKVPK